MPNKKITQLPPSATPLTGAEILPVVQSSATVQTTVVSVLGTAVANTKTTPVTVATLPVAATVGAGSRAFVSDALVPVFGATVAGSGAVPVPVYSDGAAWKVG